MFCVSSQCCHPLHVGGGRSWWALDRRHHLIGYLCVGTATTNQEEEDSASPAAGERGGRRSVHFINENWDESQETDKTYIYYVNSKRQS